MRRWSCGCSRHRATATCGARCARRSRPRSSRGAAAPPSARAAFGTELVCQVPVTLPNGKNATQPSRIIGINGSRWLLRANLLGRPAVDPDADTELLDVLTTVAVRRGSHAMPVGDPLPLTLPSEARRPGS